MDTGHVILWWHHHQPWYLDPRTGQARLPWVRLHASRGYLDMAVAAEHPSADRMTHTFNFVPSLLDQLVRYGEPGATDRWMELCAIPPSALSAAEVAEVTQRMGGGGPTPVVGLPRLDELRARVARGEALPAADLLDLTVLAQLGFCGATLCERPGVVRSLVEKGRGFTEAERAALVAETVGACAEVLKRYRALWAAGRIEVTATPYYHPILPLLIDSDVMSLALPANPRPPRFAFPEDAQEQVQRGLTRVAEVLGKKPAGMWPAEGSVSEAAVAMLGECGVTHCATDELVLRRSAGADGRAPDHADPHLDPSGRVAMFFRDHAVSDLIGFTYRFQEPEVAADDFLKRARAFASRRSGRAQPPVMTVILDGENPWEHYPRAGRPFLLALQRALSESREVRCVSPAAHLAASPVRRKLSRLHAGSWIDGTFAIWIGHGEDRHAWRLLGDARRAVERARAAGAPLDAVERARTLLMRAEGSDWFWWFGEEFHAREADMYDALFREHIREAYVALGQHPPPVLDEPVKNVHVRPRAPVGWPVQPELTGHEPSVLAWSGAVRVGAVGGAAMATGAGPVEEVLLGSTVEALWLCARFREGVIPAGELRWERVGEPPVRVSLMLPSGACTGARAAVGRVVTACWPLSACGVSHGETAEFAVTLCGADGEVVQRLPAEGSVHVEVPEAYERWRAAWA